MAQKLIDTVCPKCGVVKIDVFVNGQMPLCAGCSATVERAWLSAPSIAPNGLKKEIFVGHPEANKVDTKKIAEDVTFEIEQKMQRYSDPVVAEAHVAKEINAHLETPLPKQEPISVQRTATASPDLG